MSKKLDSGVVQIHAAFRYCALIASFLVAIYNIIVLSNMPFNQTIGPFSGYLSVVALTVVWVIVGAIVFLTISKESRRTVILVLAMYYGLAGLQIAIVPSSQPIMLVFWTILIVITYIVLSKRWAIAGTIFYGLLTLVLLFFGLDKTLSDPAMILAPLVVVAGALLLVAIFSAKNTSYEHVFLGQQRAQLDRDRMIALMNNLRDAVISTNKNGKVNLFNSAVLDLLDTNANINNAHINNLFHLETVDGVKVDIYNELTRTTSISYRDDLELIVDDHDKIRLGTTIVPILSGDSLEPTGYLIIISDITKAKSLEEERDEFISVISHELRTPITIAEGSLSNAQLFSERNLFGKMDGAISLAHKQIEFLADIVNNLSTLSRAERGYGDNSESVDIPKLISQLRAEYEPKASEKNLLFTTEVDPSLKTIRTNQLYLKELLQNLVTNAIKYTQSGSIIISITQDDESIIFSVADTGIGISKSDQKKVFNRFYRVEDYRTRETGGTGLGLHVVAKLARNLGGEIKLESRLNHGSKFSLVLKQIDKN
ncbi:hypothetical protein EOM60_00975 [Candidatus Saccharibacteria bacterium]|nr:hypothetical protein [Candidatus Saccharibacteria bacterium]